MRGKYGWILEQVAVVSPPPTDLDFSAQRVLTQDATPKNAVTAMGVLMH